MNTPRWPWVLGSFLLLALLAAAGGLVALFSAVNAAGEGVQIAVDGQTWSASGLEAVIGTLVVAAVLVCTGGALLMGLLVATVVVPVALVLLVLGVALCIVFGLAGPLLAVVALAAVLLSPLWLAGLVLWWLLRRRPAPTARMQP